MIPKQRLSLITDNEHWQKQHSQDRVVLIVNDKKCQKALCWVVREYMVFLNNKKGHLLYSDSYFGIEKKVATLTI